MSEGHAALDPVQFSATSHGPAEARQTVDDDAKPFAGQFGPVPVQFSAGSHGPAEARHTVDDDAKPSAGQLGPVPVQFSATSHGPAEARQTVLEDWKPSAGHAALDPVQFSATSHAPAEGRHTVLEDWKASAGHAARAPAQVSATSQTPAEARRRVLARPAGAVALVERAGVAVGGACGPGRGPRIGRAVRARARAVLLRIALACRRPADRARRLEAVGRTGRAGAVAGLRDVADPGRRAT